MKETKSDRRFQVWEYHVSHGELLIRSPKSPESNSSPEQLTNVDLIFDGVQYMALPRAFTGFEVADPRPEELRSIEQQIGKAVKHPQKVVVLVSGERRFYVVAAHFKIDENDLDFFESPFSKPFTN